MWPKPVAQKSASRSSAKMEIECFFAKILRFPSKNLIFNDQRLDSLNLSEMISVHDADETSELVVAVSVFHADGVGQP